jgi:hypothetical protein
MTPEERTRLNEVVNRIQVEQDSTKFLALIEELNRLLERKHTRLAERREKEPR